MRVSLWLPERPGAVRGDLARSPPTSLFHSRRILCPSLTGRPGSGMGRDGRHRPRCRLPAMGRVRPARAAGANATHEGTALPAVPPVPPGVGERPADAAEVTCTGWGESQAQELYWGAAWGLLLPPALVHIGLPLFSGNCVVSPPLPATSGPLTSVAAPQGICVGRWGPSLSPQGRWSRLQCLPGTSSSSHTPKPCGDTPLLFLR